MQEHILENIVTAFNNYARVTADRQGNIECVQLGGVELLFELLEKSLSGYVSAKIRFHRNAVHFDRRGFKRPCGH